MRALLLVVLLATLAGAQESAVRSSALAALGALPAGCELAPLNTPQDAEGLGGRLECQVMSGLDTSTPRVRVSLVGSSRSWVVAFRKSFRPPVLVVNRLVKRGEVPDVVVEPRLVYPGQIYLSKPSEVAGLRLKRDLRPGEMVRPQDLEPIPFVESGCTMSVTTNLQGVVLHREGKALEAGYPGRTFRVRTPEGKILNVSVVNQEVVERTSP